MKIATVIMIVLAIALGSVALAFGIKSPQSPISPDNSSTSSVTQKVDNREKLASISEHYLELGSVPLVPTIENEVYRLNDYSKFYRVSSDGFSEFTQVKNTLATVHISDEVCKLDIRYVELDGRVVGGGIYEKVIEQDGVYSVNLKLKYTLTEMPSALAGQEGEKLLLVAYSSNDYYSEAYAISLDGGYSRNLFSQSGREEKNSDGYVMLTDELVKNSGEYLYFFSSRLYDRGEAGVKFNVYKNIDLFRTKDGADELVASYAHHNYVADLGGGKIRFLRSDYAMLSYTVGSIPVTSFQEMNFEVVELNLDTMTETVLMESDMPYSSGYRQFGDRLVRLSPDHYGILEVYDISGNESKSYSGLKMRTISGFDISDDGRYIVVGGYVSTVSTVNQSVHLIDTHTAQTLNIDGKEIFLAVDGNFGFIDAIYFVNSHYDSSETKITFYITRTEKIFKTFKESVED